MISIYELKPRFQRLLLPVVDRLHRMNITPNQVTLAACFLSVLLGVLFYLNHESIWIYIILPIFMFIRMAMNAIDGVLAKKYSLQTKLGKFLNELTDVISDASLFLPFMLLVEGAEMTVVIFVLLSVTSEMAGVIAEAASGERRYDGPMGKSDRAFLIGLLSVLIVLGVPVGPYLWIIFLTASLLIALNIYKRVKNGLEVNA
ncbi:MAG TPA: CDP-alcohol phosphatidyltransferase family protein [Candidatus Salinicoccus stercoripullorum]|uniref:CDP-alcohol phosphatidyltransferase family protein n=1 Tax=Candidatus Salinicoccus stercoripullorum TaxID=2838756 RepID=A0A9D1QI99_9STAP|nr:CDP-alcohol phosphatidyltransferase family protein [Candidatus Salinicoccus stercoripullorum]